MNLEDPAQASGKFANKLQPMLNENAATVKRLSTVTYLQTEKGHSKAVNYFSSTFVRTCYCRKTHQNKLISFLNIWEILHWILNVRNQPDRDLWNNIIFIAADIGSTCAANRSMKSC